MPLFDRKAPRPDGRTAIGARRGRHGLPGRFGRDVRGSVTVQMTIFFVMLMGTVGLVIDFGRVYAANTSAQAYVDQIALAAAAELDNQPGAIARARNAAFGVGMGPDAASPPLWKLTPGGADGLIEVEELIFLSDMPDDPQFQYTVSDLSPYFTTDDADANYVAAISRQISMRTTMLRLVAWGSGVRVDEMATRTVAVATMQSEVCESPLLMICNPYEGDPSTTFADQAIPGRQVLMKKHSGGGNAWAPGNFGTIDLPQDAFGVCPTNSGNASSRQWCLLGVNQLANGCQAATVDMDPGQSISVNAGLNIRFDIWNTQMKNFIDDPNFAPDANVIKGLTNGMGPQSSLDLAPPAGPSFLTLPPGAREGAIVLAGNNNHNGGGGNGGGPPPGGGNPAKGCTAKDFEAASSSTYSPRDPCFDAGTCPERISPPVTQAMLQAYWSENHPTANGGVLPDGLTTRYQVYQYELDGLDGDPATDDDLLDVDGNEYGAPVCTATPGVRDRRTFTMAVVDCATNGVTGNASGVPVAYYVRMFLTEPVVDNQGSPSDDDIYAEVVSLIESGDGSGVLHEFPFLVR